MPYQVPQFIETEDKLVGPFTFKQFLYIAIPSVASTLLYYFAPLWLFAILSTILMGIGGTLAFVKVNGRPVVFFIAAYLGSSTRPDIYILKADVPLYIGQLESDENLKKMGFFARIWAAILGLFKKERVPQPKGLETRKRKFNIVDQKTTSKINEINQKLSTSTKAIALREKPLPQNFGIPKIEINERLEVVRHDTGKREVARRIDYR